PLDVIGQCSHVKADLPEEPESTELALVGAGADLRPLAGQSGARTGGARVTAVTGQRKLRVSSAEHPDDGHHHFRKLVGGPDDGRLGTAVFVRDRVFAVLAAAGVPVFGTVPLER